MRMAADNSRFGFVCVQASATDARIAAGKDATGYARQALGLRRPRGRPKAIVIRRHPLRALFDSAQVADTSSDVIGARFLALASFFGELCSTAGFVLAGC